jgi:hypothetical protein
MGVHPTSLITHLEATISGKPLFAKSQQFKKKTGLIIRADSPESTNNGVWSNTSHYKAQIVTKGEKNPTLHMPEHDLASRKWALVNILLRYRDVARE